jgi:hypothetical protein
MTDTTDTTTTTNEYSKIPKDVLRYVARAVDVLRTYELELEKWGVMDKKFSGYDRYTREVKDLFAEKVERANYKLNHFKELAVKNKIDGELVIKELHSIGMKELELLQR